MTHQMALPTREVKDAVMEGLRSSISAYTAIRQAWKLRFEETDRGEFTGEQTRDTEEQSLLNEAEADFQFLMNREHQPRASTSPETR